LPDSTSTVQVDGASVVGSFVDYDDLIAALRARIGAVGLSYAALEELTGMAEGQVGKYLSDARAKNLSVRSLLQIAEVIGVRGLFVEDERLLRKYRPLFTNRDARKVHARRRAKLSANTLHRMMPAVASEMGRRGAHVRNAALTPETRRELARAAARARWAHKSGRRG
jgi:transcriptional regulator with XRE-family HTH domain